MTFWVLSKTPNKEERLVHTHFHYPQVRIIPQLNQQVLRRHKVNLLCWLCASRWDCAQSWDTGRLAGGAFWLIIQILPRMLQRTDGMWRFKRSVGQRAFELWPLNCGSSQRAGDKGVASPRAAQREHQDNLTSGAGVKKRSGAGQKDEVMAPLKGSHH